MSSVKTVRVSNVSLSATEQDIHQFFSYSGVIAYVEMKSENERSQTAFVTFKDTHGAETAVLLTGATVVDQAVNISLEPDYVLPPTASAYSTSENHNTGAEDVVSSMLAKGFILGKDALSKAKSFDEKHQVLSTASAKVSSLDQKIGLSEKITIGATIVNDKVREVDQKFQVSEKTKTAFASAGSTIMKNRYVLTGATWVTGAFSRVTKAAEEVSQRTMEKVAEGERGKNESERYGEIHTTESRAYEKGGTSDKKPSSPKGLIL